MWIFLSDSFLSIVQKPGQTDALTIRARIAGDIERVFPDAVVQAGRGTDYKYRAEVPRAKVMAVLSAQVAQLQYPNFKASVKDRARHDAYLDVWAAMNRTQR